MDIKCSIWHYGISTCVCIIIAIKGTIIILYIIIFNNYNNDTCTCKLISSLEIHYAHVCLRLTDLYFIREVSE